MQLFADGNLEEAIEELKIVIPIAGLQNVIEHRVANHQSRGALLRRLILLRVEQIRREAAV